MKQLDEFNMWRTLRRARRSPWWFLEDAKQHIDQGSPGKNKFSSYPTTKARELLTYCQVLIATGKDRSPEFWRS